MIINFVLFVSILVPLTWGRYLLEDTKNTTLELYGAEYLSNKKPINENKTLLQAEIHHSDNNKYLFKFNDYGQQSLTIAKQPKTIAHQQQSLPLPPNQTSYDINDDVVNAKNNTTNKHSVNHVYLEAQPPSLSEQKQQEQQQLNHNDDVMLNEVNNNNDFNSTLRHGRQRRQLSDFLIAPNTRWCGRGNTANGTYNHLGGASMADKCCRTHDHCKVYIPAMSNRFDLFNYRPYTLSHCNCDRRFRTCLKMANDEDANTIGKLFFNLVQTQCFTLVKERVCQQRASDGTCLKEHVKQKAYLRNNKKY